MEHSDNLAYCRELAAPPGSGLHYACLFVAPALRERVITLHAWDGEIHRSLAASEDPGVVRMRLQWWREELQRADAGEARHPVGQALQALLRDKRLTSTDLAAYLNAREADLEAAGHDDFPALLDSYSHGAGHLWRLSGTICGLQDVACLNALARLGGLHYLFLALRDLAGDLRLGRCRAVPRAELRAAGLEPDTAARADEAHWQSLLGGQFQRLHDELRNTIETIPPTAAAMAPHCAILASMDVALCREVMRDGCAVLRKRYHLTPLRKLWIAWRTHRRLG